MTMEENKDTRLEELEKRFNHLEKECTKILRIGISAAILCYGIAFIGIIMF